MSHAGPSITITSFTNSVAFYFGASTSLIALRSFCYFAASCIVCLFLSVLTLFSCVMVWDLRRIHKKRGDICCCCCCPEDCILCCRGRFLSEKQKAFSFGENDNNKWIAEVEGEPAEHTDGKATIEANAAPSNDNQVGPSNIIETE
jgi:hypothetical protein